MLLCPSSHRTRTRGGCSWSTSSITPARLGCATFSDSTTILSPAWGRICVSPSCSDSLVLLERLARPSRRVHSSAMALAPGRRFAGIGDLEADVAKSGRSPIEGRRGSVLGIGRDASGSRSRASSTGCQWAWSRSWAPERLGLEEDGQGGGEPVQEGLAADGTDLAAAEEAGEGLRPECLGDDARVVVGLGEHVRAAAVAGEEQCPGRPPAAERAAQRLPEICVRRGCVADEEAQRLPDPDAVAERERAGRLVGAQETAHEEVAGLVLGPVLVDHEPGKEPARGERLLLGGEGGDLPA